jgi:hypothetical protein
VLLSWAVQHSVFRSSRGKVRQSQWLEPSFWQVSCTALLVIMKRRFPDTRGSLMHLCGEATIYPEICRHFCSEIAVFYGGTKRNHESAENRLDRGFRGPPNQQSVVVVCPAVWIACTHKNMRDRSDTDRERCYLAPALGWPVPNPIDLESPLVDSFCSDCTR